MYPCSASNVSGAAAAAAQQECSHNRHHYRRLAAWLSVPPYRPPLLHTLLTYYHFQLRAVHDCSLVRLRLTIPISRLLVWYGNFAPH